MREQNPIPLEQSDPALAEHFRLIANRQHPAVKSISISSGDIFIVCHDRTTISKTPGQKVILHPDGRRTVTTTGRNDPCPCGSGKKFKKCCGA